MMEAIERYSGEFCPRPTIFRSYDQLALEADAVDPSQLIAHAAPNTIQGSKSNGWMASTS